MLLNGVGDIVCYMRQNRADLVLNLAGQNSPPAYAIVCLSAKTNDCVRSVRYDLNQSRAVPWTANQCLGPFSAGAGPRTPLRELMTLPRLLVGWGGGHPLPIPFLSFSPPRFPVGPHVVKCVLRRAHQTVNPALLSSGGSRKKYLGGLAPHHLGGNNG